MLLFLLLFFMVLLSIAFLTLMERKILGYMQIRKGPNKMSVLGLVQPVLDGMKLFMKESFYIKSVNKFMFNVFPFLFFMLMMNCWFMYMFNKYHIVSYSLVFFILISGLSVHSVLGVSWASNSKYALLGAYRLVSQTVSYEVGLVFLLMNFVLLSKSYNLLDLMVFNNFSLMSFYIMFNLFLIWLVVMLAELNRAPFVFLWESKSAGFWVYIEFGSGKFALLFLAEYGNIIFFFLFEICYIFYKKLNIINVINFIFSGMSASNISSLSLW
ncbi:NADH dehydrogenase subunit 1 (mitochondrion) [Galendromus occidentalis]|uniref:NADH-ubiquinone oxidoreductase chain 1 n=1 Tax=Galendromus occidentalis TaxID=34638 RepID=A3RE56_9ACAR|nr:NADH dehydrogenase subunit 1 [Galendromus occidentalis]ABN45844.2 NADH dehydrogenase subunit 1 [Galendromus occidentalis]